MSRKGTRSKQKTSNILPAEGNAGEFLKIAEQIFTTENEVDAWKTRTKPT